LPKPLVVIKLGGAALTDKTRIYTPRVRIIHSAARQIATIRKTRSVLLLHGAGSYGHIPVKRFDLVKGFHNSAQLKGLSETKFRLLQWESKLNRIFLQHEIPIVPFQPSCYTIARRGRIFSCEIDSIKAMIRLGCTPSIGGDIVSDVSTGFSIISGDQLAAYMAIALKARMLVFATDVDGIFNVNPKTQKRAQLIEKLDASSIRRITTTGVSQNITDVTGGMKGKLEEAATAASNGIPVFFVNLLKGNRLQDLILGKRVICSEVVRG
jgi:isopentenyl phosphate kinase